MPLGMTLPLVLNNLRKGREQFEEGAGNKLRKGRERLEEGAGTI